MIGNKFAENLKKLRTGFGNLLKQLRKEKCITQEALDDYLDVGVADIRFRVDLKRMNGIELSTPEDISKICNKD